MDFNEAKRKAEIDGTETTRRFRKRARLVILLATAVLLIIYAAYLFK